ncbi:MAG: hypothetical protein VYE27_03940 [Pseudomonadota bacterium]|nr:hypothetical protein [Pseudomonadota bacterium]
MISLTKIIDPLSGYIAKVQKDISDRQKDQRERVPVVSGPATQVSAEQTTQAVLVNRLVAEINEITAGLQNARDGLGTLDEAENAYNDVLYVLGRMEKKFSAAQEAERNNRTLESDSASLTAALTLFNAELEQIAENRKYKNNTLIDGSFTNKAFPMWGGQSRTPKISLENLTTTLTSNKAYSAFALAGNVNSSINGTNIAANKSVTITAENGSNSFSQLAGESASSLANRINLLENDIDTEIGVTASARTSLRLSDLTNAGTLSLSIGSERVANVAQNIGNVVISDKTNLSNLMVAINRISAKTNVFASMGDSGTDIVLRDPLGGNINISNFAHSVSDTTLSVSVDRRDGLTDFSLNGEITDYNNVSTGFASGRITFGHVGNVTSENINLGVVAPANENAAGAVSIDSSKNIYLGNGSSKIQIGSVNSSNNGRGGNALQIDFSGNSRVFSNSTFSSDSNWTKNSSQIVSGTTSVNGIRTRLDRTFPDQQGASGTFTVNGGSDGDTISAVTINGVNLLGSSVSYSTDNNTTAGLISNAINNNSSNPNYTASVSGAVVTIAAADNTGYAPNSYSISYSASGSFSATGTSLSGGVDTDKESITGGSPFSTTISGGEATLSTNNATTTNPTSLVKGPALISDNDVFLLAKEQVSFSWSGSGQNSDHFDVQAYLVNTANNNGNNGRTVTMLNTTGASGSGTATGTIGITGNYKLVIVSGAFDNDGDRDSSSTVTIDNVAISAITDDVLDVIKDNITYENLNISASNTSYTPQVSVTSVTGSGSSTTEAIDVPASLTGFSLTEGADQEVFATGEVSVLSASSFSITQQDNNTNGTTFFESETTDASSLTLSSISASAELVPQLATERISQAIANVTKLKEKYLTSYRSQFDFGEFDTSNYLDSLNMTKVKTMEPDSALSMKEQAIELVIADEIQNLLAKVGNASARDVYSLLKFN